MMTVFGTQSFGYTATVEDSGCDGHMCVHLDEMCVTE